MCRCPRQASSQSGGHDSLQRRADEFQLPLPPLTIVFIAPIANDVGLKRHVAKRRHGQVGRQLDGRKGRGRQTAAIHLRDSVV